MTRIVVTEECPEALSFEAEPGVRIERDLHAHAAVQSETVVGRSILHIGIEVRYAAPERKERRHVRRLREGNEDRGLIVRDGDVSNVAARREQPSAFRE